MTRGQDSRLALGRLGALVEQLETLVRGGREIILVTSDLLFASHVYSSSVSSHISAFFSCCLKGAHTRGRSSVSMLFTLGCAGGVSIGRQKLRQQKVLNSSPLEMQFAGGGQVPSRAATAAGQSGLMALYDSLFGMMDLQAAQVLVTRNDFTGMV